MKSRAATWLTIALATSQGVLAACDEAVNGGNGGNGGGGTASGVGGSAGGAAGAGGSAAGGGGPSLELIHAKTLSPYQVLLTFAEAVRPPDGVDPTDFQLSLVESARNGEPAWRLCGAKHVITGSDYYHYTCGALKLSDCFGYYDACHQNWGHTSHCDLCWLGVADRDYTRYDNDQFVSDHHAHPVRFAKLERGPNDDEIVATIDTTHPAAAIGDCVNKTLYLHYTEHTPIRNVPGDKTLASIAKSFAQLCQQHHGSCASAAQAFLPEHPFPVETDLCGAGICTNGIADDGETDVDCGGRTSCARCTTGQKCLVDRDCASGNCTAGSLTCG